MSVLESTISADEQKVSDLVDELLAKFPPSSTPAQTFLGEQFDRGLAWVHFAVGNGGLGLSPKLQKTVNEKIFAAGGPNPVMRNPIGHGMCGPTVVVWGTEAQKTRYLRPLFTGEEVWCQLFSEPGAGSDVAGLATKAVRDGDEWIINGQKVWTTLAHVSRFGLLISRSDPDAVKHAGITAFVVDMHSPGVEVRPLRQITGEAEFNEIFFNDVEVPVSWRLGDEGQGWQVAMTTLLHERGTLGFALTASLEASVNKLLEVARDRVNGDEVARERIATEWIELQALRYTNYRSLGTLQRTGIPGPEGSAIKLRWSEQNQRLTKLGRELLGAEGILDDGWWHHQQLRSRGNTIEAGTSEVLRNIVAERVLGLPKNR